MPIDPLPRGQREVFAAILAAFRTNGVAPSVAELAMATGARSHSRVHAQLDALVARGLILRARGKHRGIRVRPDLLYDVAHGLPGPVGDLVRASLVLVEVAGHLQRGIPAHVTIPSPAEACDGVVAAVGALDFTERMLGS